MNLKQLRKAKGLKCEDLAQASGVSVHTLRAYERGARQMSTDVLHRMAQALGVSMDEAYQAYSQRAKNSR